MKTVIILRGVSGAGKTTIAKALTHNDHTFICEANDYMVDEDGNFKFNASRLQECHDKCYDKFKALVDSGAEMIVQSNNNLSVRDYERYIAYARSRHYFVHVMSVEHQHGGRSSHNVPSEVLHRQEQTMRRNRLRG